MKYWFQKKTPQTKDKDTLSKAYDSKYGDYDYNTDSRALDKKFQGIFEQLIAHEDFGNVIVCGANSGYEINIIRKIKPEARVVAVDISSTSLEKLHARFPEVTVLHEDLEKLDGIESERFDLYVCLRAIHSTNINLSTALKEATRITKKKLILSVSNGYVVDGGIVNGMYNYGSDSIDSSGPFIVRDEIVSTLTDLGWESEVIESDAEIFIVSTKL